VTVMDQGRFIKARSPRWPRCCRLCDVEQRMDRAEAAKQACDESVLRVPVSPPGISCTVCAVCRVEGSVEGSDEEVYQSFIYARTPFLSSYSALGKFTTAE